MVTIKQLTEFLISRKMSLVTSERIAKGKTRMAIAMQIECFESILIFLSQNLEGDDMTKLQLSLDAVAIPVTSLKRKTSQNITELVATVTSFLANLEPGYVKPLNDPAIKNKKSFAAKLYRLKKKGILPAELDIVSQGKEILIGKK